MDADVEPAAATEPSMLDTPSPSHWPAAWEERARIAASLCDPVYQKQYAFTQEEPDIGCFDCSHIGAASKKKPRPVDNVGSPLGKVFDGSFSGPHRSEAIAIVGECGVRLSSGSFLLRRGQHGFRFARFLGGADNCQKTRLKTGRDVLVCFAGHPSGDEEAVEIFVIDAARTPSHRTLAVFDLFRSTALAACGGHVPPLLAGEVSSPELRDVDSDGIDDIVIAGKLALISPAQERRIRSRPDFKAACGCASELHLGEKLKPGCSCPRVFPRQVKVSLIYLQRGDSFVPTESTKRLLARMGADKE